jgi:hypothetical protein
VAAVLEERASADVLLVTDGKSHALDVHALARRGARFTVVLVGEDSLAANVGHLAALTGGQVFVSSGLDLAEGFCQVSRQTAHLASWGGAGRLSAEGIGSRRWTV